MNSRAPAIVVKPARTMNCPAGDQNRWLHAFFSNFSVIRKIDLDTGQLAVHNKNVHVINSKHTYSAASVDDRTELRRSSR